MKQQQAKIIFGIYALVVMLELLFIYFDEPQLRWFTKPLLMPLLMLGFYVASANRNGTLFYLILFALLLSWAGDVLLQMNGMFIPGLISFLLAHVCYIIYFSKTGKHTKGLIQLKPLIALPVLLYILLLLYLLFPYLDTLKIPLNTKYKSKNIVSLFFITGALLFVISDSLLAINLFAYKHLMLSLLVMITYSSAQYLIVSGAILNEE
jgi:uncharacterized membrane protein YhhN